MQSASVVLPLSLLYLPLPHTLQLPLCPVMLLHEPAGHTSQLFAEVAALSLPVLPSPHSVQPASLVAPAESPYLPVGQALHVVAPPT
jgi:hypothetical protein